jgi:hypothetical protein
MRNDEIVKEYNAMYRPEPTPYSHPELFDPLNPPEGYAYDSWHAIWWKHPTESQARAQAWFVALCCVIMLAWIGNVIYAG